MDNKLSFPNGVKPETIVGAYDAISQFIRDCPKEDLAIFSLVFIGCHKDIMYALKDRLETGK